MTRRPKQRRGRWLEFKSATPLRTALMLGLSIWVIFFGLWEMAGPLGWVTELLVPGPGKVMAALYDLIVNRGFLVDIGISVYRIVISFIGACAVAVPLGLPVSYTHLTLPTKAEV